MWSSIPHHVLISKRLLVDRVIDKRDGCSSTAVYEIFDGHAAKPYSVSHLSACSRGLKSKPGDLGAWRPWPHRWCDNHVGL